MPGQASTVDIYDRDGVRRVTLRRPPVNALGLNEYDAMAAAFAVWPGQPGSPRVILLQAEGTTWCAGQDLRELAAHAGREQRAAYLLRATQGVATVARCPIPVVTVLDGPAIGAGALLVACSDIVLSSSAGSVAFPEVRLGMKLGRSLLAGFLPEQVITYAFVTGASIDADRLRELGAVADVVPAIDIATNVESTLTDLLSLSDTSLRWLCRRRSGSLAQDYESEVASAIEELKGW